MPEIPQRINRIRYPIVEITGMMGSRGEIVEETPPRVIEDKIYVAVGKDVKESQLTLKWALHNSGGRKICILHVHQPADKIPIMGTKFRINQLEEHQVRSYHETERQNMHQLLEKYCLFCQQAGVRIEKQHIEMDSIEKGIIELIQQHGVRKLVMGAASDRLYSKKMMEPKSKKAIYVRLQAHVSCHIWFICKGNLIYTREGRLDGLNVGVATSSLQAITNNETGQSSSLRSRSVTEGQNDRVGLSSPASHYLRVMSDNHGTSMSTFASPSLQAITNNETGQSSSLRSRSVIEGQNDKVGLSSPVSHYHRVMSDNHGTSMSTFASPLLQAITNNETGQSSSLRSRSVIEGQNDKVGLSSPASHYHRVMSDSHGMNMSTFSSPDGNRGLTPQIRSNAEGVSDEWNGIPRRSPSVGSRFSTCSSSELDDSGLISYAITEGSKIELDYNATPLSKDNFHHSSPPSVLQERSMNDELYDQLVQAMAEADNSKRDALEESIRRRKAEKDAIEAVRRIKASEIAYAEELKRRREVEEALARGREEHEKIKQQLDEAGEELRIALEQKSSLESQIANSDQMVQELEQKIFSAVDLLQNYKRELDELQVERDDALRLAEELREKQTEEASSSSSPQFFYEFPFSEIEEATRNFDPALKIGEGGYGSIYRGVLRHTQVAIKMPNSNSEQGASEFQQEVNVLSKLRHPNLVTLIGACPEMWILVYEYLSGGSLEDRLSCKDNSPPLSWQTRIRIAAELCSVLIFLHSCSIVHGDLKPANLLLDGNFVSKLSDFGICRVLSQDEYSSNNTTLCCITNPKGTLAYVDPEFVSTGELTSKSDVYSFGIILLRLLTGKPPFSITKEVQDALDKGNLKNILDPTAGDWPFVQAKQLAHLALNCCVMTRRNRPDLVSDAQRLLEPMRVSCGVSSFRFGSEGQCQIPHYFICPIFQEIMQDPVVAADGFTYEAEALRGWLDSGHNTSPMTNLELTNTNLVPNHALRSAIQEWLQQT